MSCFISDRLKHKERKMEKHFFVIAALLLVASGLKEGDRCTSHAGEGVCKKIERCKKAMRDLKRGIKTPKCSDKDRTVCCLDDDNARENLPLKPKKPPTIFKKECSPIANNVTIPKDKWRKSFQKCLEYQEKLVYPCQESQNPNEGMIRENRCNWTPDSLIIGGVDTHRGEFPHMVHLGYGENETVWACGGVLLSERFVLTAGHCTKAAKYGGSVTVSEIRIAFFRKTEKKIRDVNLYKVKNIHKHPDYIPPFVYNDIALIESDRPMKLGRFAVPACLHDGRPIDDSEVYVTGWGTLSPNKKNLPDVLQKVVLEKYSDEDCQKRYRKIRIRLLERGYNSSTQVCYGHHEKKRDSCEGDSGGPLQVYHPEIKCMYLVTSIISVGKWCATPELPGINTRIAPYLDWIESIVWNKN